MLAVGLTLEEMPYYRGQSLKEYTPCGDYVVIKFARWAFDKFKDAEDKLGTQMKSGRRKSCRSANDIQGGVPKGDPIP